MNKYHNKKEGGWDSRKEHRRWDELVLLQRAGEIRELQRQVRFELIPAQYRNGKCVERNCCYIADFVYYKDGQKVVEDVKGYKEGEAYRLFAIKRKLMLQKYNLHIKET